MAWVRFGDTAATHPVVVRGGGVSGADSRTRFELLGFVASLASQSGLHQTDYMVELGTVRLLAGEHADRLLAQATEAGYLTPGEVDGRPAWRIIDDPDLFHMRTRAEIAWDRRRKADNGNIDLTLEVLRRDGSACRYCGRSVNWADRRGTRGATYDHRRKPASSPDHMVVACRGCNSARGEPGSDQAAQFDRANPLLPAPAEPHYCDHARARLERHGATPTDVTSAGKSFGRKSPADTAPEDRPGTRPGSGSRPGIRPGSGTSVERPASNGRPGTRPGDGRPAKPTPADLARGTEVNSPGSGRVGSGQVGSGRAGPGRGGSGGRNRRRRRGRRR